MSFCVQYDLKINHKEIHLLDILSVYLYLIVKKKIAFHMGIEGSGQYFSNVFSQCCNIELKWTILK